MNISCCLCIVGNSKTGEEMFVILSHGISDTFYHPTQMRYTTSYPSHLYPYQATDPIPYLLHSIKQYVLIECTDSVHSEHPTHRCIHQDILLLTQRCWDATTASPHLRYVEVLDGFDLYRSHKSAHFHSYLPMPPN